MPQHGLHGGHGGPRPGTALPSRCSQLHSLARVLVRPLYDQRTTFPKIKGTYLKKLPLPATPSKAAQREIAEVVGELIRLTTQLSQLQGIEKQRLERAIVGQERVLDAKVAACYHLTVDQVMRSR